jgi:hypothetical protein
MKRWTVFEQRSLIFEEYSIDTPKKNIGGKKHRVVF